MFHIVNKNEWIYILYDMLRLLVGQIGMLPIFRIYIL